MKHRILAFAAAAGLLSIGLVLFNEAGARRPRGGASEKWVNGNLVRVLIAGHWEEFPLVPLADHLCESAGPLLRHHCP